jgi:hypothetical protein
LVVIEFVFGVGLVIERESEFEFADVLINFGFGVLFGALKGFFYFGGGGFLHSLVWLSALLLFEVLLLGDFDCIVISFVSAEGFLRAEHFLEIGGYFLFAHLIILLFQYCK